MGWLRPARTAEPVKIVDSIEFEAWDTDVVVGGWRDYNFLIFHLEDNGTDNLTYDSTVFVPSLDEEGSVGHAVETNAQLTVTPTADSDSLNLDQAGGTVSSFPDAGDTLTVWGVK